MIHWSKFGNVPANVSQPIEFEIEEGYFICILSRT
jgi:hypothetical protein